MTFNIASIWDWPIAVWVVLLACVAFAGEYVSLLIRRHHSVAGGNLAEARLSRVATALKKYALQNANRLPLSLQELNVSDTDNVVYRPTPKLDFDEKLILLHDSEPTHRIIEFPALREGRGLVFCSGKMHIVSEEIFDKLMYADNALRERLGLEAVEERMSHDRK